MPKNESKPLNDNNKKYTQQVVGIFLYYARAIGMTILMALSNIASKQSKPTEQIMEHIFRLLDYMYKNPNAII